MIILFPAKRRNMFTTNELMSDSLTG